MLSFLLRVIAAGGVKILLSAMRSAVAAGYQHLQECFSALPLYHFLQDKCTPFGRLEMAPANIKFRCELFTISSKTYDDYRG